MSDERGDQAVGECIKAYLDALASDDTRLLAFIKNRQAAIDDWFGNPEEGTTEAKAKEIVTNGDFDTAKLHLLSVPPPTGTADAWLTLWLV